MNKTQSLARRPEGLASFRLVLLAGILTIIAGCGQHGQHVPGTLLTVSEGLGTPQEEGTLMLVEVITPLTREHALGLFRSVDLQTAGLKESDMSVGTAVFVSPWKQSQSAFFPPQGLYALVSPTAGSLDSGASSCKPSGCSYGGDAVAIRVVKRPAGGVGEPVLYIVESIVEPRSIRGDCYYFPRGSRRALHCKSLDSKGWEWQEDVFVKRPGATRK